MRSQAGLRWVRGLAFPAPSWWPSSVPWPDQSTATPMSATLWTVLVQRAIAPDWELADEPVDMGDNLQKLNFKPRDAAAIGAGLGNSSIRGLLPSARSGR